MFSIITTQDMKISLRGFKMEYAPGSDGLHLTDLNKICTNELRLAFNIWFRAQIVPIELKVNRTVMIQKSSFELDKVTSWRSITISTIIVRLYCGRNPRNFIEEKK